MKNKKHKDMQGLDTRAVHAGAFVDGKARPGITPIYQSSTFALNDAVYAAMRGDRARDELIYTRYDNPSVRAVELKLAALEGAQDALAFASGMGAISAVLEHFLKPGDRLVIGRDLYGGTDSLVKGRLKDLGVQIAYVPTEDSVAWRDALKTPAKLVYCEAVTNPLLKVADLDVISEAAHAAGAIAVVDATFATPVNLRPMEHGFDLVLHSGSKYLGGHSDLICGAVAGSADLIQKLWKRRTLGGACLDPHAAFLLERGMKTLGIRVQRQNANAFEIARRLAEHPRVLRVLYPGLESHPQHAVAKRLMDGFGGMVSFSLSSDSSAQTFLKRLKIIREATSLGGVESVISMPMNTSQALLSESERIALGIIPGTMRMSCGIEDIGDLVGDLEQALRL